MNGVRDECDIGYPDEDLDPDNEDDGTMVASKEALEEAIIGRKIVSAGKEVVTFNTYGYEQQREAFVIYLDNGKRVALADTDDCCAYTTLEQFFLDPSKVQHAISGVGTTDGYSKWHIFCDYGDIATMEVGWSCGNPFYYGYGFDIIVEDIK